MEAHTQPQKPPRIGVFTPFLQDQFFGELLAQIQQLCLVKNYQISIIRTNGLGEYTSPTNIAHLDFCIFLRNAVHPRLAESIVKAGIPCASIAYDYYPLDIPVIGCDNELGVELAVNHLLKLGHRHLGYVGNIRNYDVRKRYEAFCDQLAINNLELDENSIFITDDDFFVGANKAANDYIRGGCVATGIVCGTGLIGMSFEHQVAKLMPHKRAEMNIVCFDALSAIAVKSPSLAVIDQNLHFVAYKAIQVFEDYRSGKNIEHSCLVEPQLRSDNSDYASNEQAYLATSTDVQELMSPTYMKSILDSIHEWPKYVVNNNLDDIAQLSILFPDQVDKACYARVKTGKEGKKVAKTLKVMSGIGSQKISSSDTGSVSPLSHYPANCKDFDFTNADCSFHLAIYKQEKIWAILSVIGKHSDANTLSSIRALFPYLEQIVELFQAKIVKTNDQDANTRDIKNLEEVKTGLIQLREDKQTTEWDDTALDMIGVKSDLEKSIYRHFELVDCFDQNDLVKLIETLAQDSEAPFVLDVHIRHRDKSVLPFKLSSQAKLIDHSYALKIEALDPTE